MKLTDQQIREIADLFDCGMRCFYNVKTGEIKSVINSDKWIGAEEEFWEEDLAEIMNNQDSYLEFESMSSHDSFQIMIDFLETVKDQNLYRRLINALEKPKPFKNFKWEIDNSGLYRQKWFDFKNERIFEFVKLQVENLNLNNKED